MQHSKEKIFHHVRLCGVFCSLFLLLSSSAKANPAEYDLRDIGKRHSVVQIYERKTDHVVWTHPYSILGTYPNVGTFFWSRDHRAVAFVANGDGRRKFPSDYEGYEIIVWRAGKKIHVVTHKPVTAYDYVENLVWSANGKLLLIWAGGSGEEMGNRGHLFCFDAGTYKIYSLGDTIGKPSWVGVQTAKFWHVDYDSMKEGTGMVRDRKPSYWHLTNTHRRNKGVI